jgi:hypothetical protein
MTPPKRPVCDNADHDRARKPPAVARMSWPDGRFSPCLACATCLRWHVRYSIDGTHGTRHPVLVSPLEATPGGYATTSPGSA